MLIVHVSFRVHYVDKKVGELVQLARVGNCRVVNVLFPFIDVAAISFDDADFFSVTVFEIQMPKNVSIFIIIKFRNSDFVSIRFCIPFECHLRSLTNRFDMVIFSYCIKTREYVSVTIYITKLF